jgi:hypothetical protein
MSAWDQLPVENPQVDHTKIVLEMDLVDKSKVDEEKSLQSSNVALMKNRDPDALDMSDRIEMIRRELVLNELGIDVPRKAGTGEVDVKALFDVQLSKQDKNEEEEADAYSPLRTERAGSSVLTEIKPKFPLKSVFAVREDLTLDPQKHFYREVKKLLERKEGLTDFADLQKTKE